MLVAGGLKLVVISGALGLTLALVATRLLGGLLFEIDALDPLTFLRVPLVRGAAAARGLPASPPRQSGQSRRRARDRLSAGGPKRHGSMASCRYDPPAERGVPGLLKKCFRSEYPLLPGERGVCGERYGLRPCLAIRFESAAYVNSDASHSQFRSQFASGLDRTPQDRLSPSAAADQITSRARRGWRLSLSADHGRR